MDVLHFRKNNVWLIFAVLSAIISGLCIASGKLLYIGLLLVPLLVYFSIKNPFIFPFGIYTLLIPFDYVLSFTESGQGTTLTKLFGILVILVLLMKGAFESKLTRPDSVTIWSIIFISYGLTSVLWAIESEPILSALPSLLGLFFLYLTVGSYKIKQRDIETIKWCVAFGGLIAAAYTMNSYLAGDTYGTKGRASLIIGGKVVNPNAFVFGLIMPISTCIHLFLKHKKIVLKTVIAITFGMMLFCVIISGSRGGALAVMTVICIYLFLTKQRLAFILIILLAAIIIVPYVPDFFTERIDDAIETKGSGRTHILYVGWKALEKYGIFGAGLGNYGQAFNEFEIYSPSFQGHDRGAHNLYLGHLVELGVFGFTLLIVFIAKHYSLIKSKFKHENHESIMLKASFWGILVQSLFIDPLFRKSFWLLWMIIVMYKNISLEKEIG
jgi:O-antigen ligase